MTVSKPSAGQSSMKELVVGKRTYTDNSGPDFQQPLLDTVVAITTLAVYTAWPYILFLLILFAWFPPVFLLNVVLYSTLLMPAQLFWAEFLNWELFRTWREYFNFSYKTTEVMLSAYIQIFNTLPLFNLLLDVRFRLRSVSWT